MRLRNKFIPQRISAPQKALVISSAGYHLPVNKKRPVSVEQDVFLLFYFSPDMLMQSKRKPNLRESSSSDKRKCPLYWLGSDITQPKSLLVLLHKRVSWHRTYLRSAQKTSRTALLPAAVRSAAASAHRKTNTVSASATATRT